ncbi:MerR family transcriptional regulator [Nocardiopsis tropica]|uniref:MerR family transcriptional regulator n=1 Tax=Nocardiopsis tropica TaxID=109330 RepID=A0ABU7L3L6_9ACTN|nr:MerR family transcriptional regulator [Nocardiopsis umidischolae]MEE2055512.1 MerR family transcriptional regulator [Nocardiopsis umidischolae]
MSWPIGDLCRMSGVTSRTLRHYHRIGLLEPEWTGPGGIRHYGRGELLRLQRILVMRELGMGLAGIARVLDERTGEADALRAHLRDLLAERDRIDTLVDTVRRTIGALEEDDGMHDVDRPEELFAGFDTTAYTERARAEWPREWEQARQADEELTGEDRDRQQAELAARMRRMADHLAAGTPPADPAVQAEVHAHYLGVSRMWTPDAGAFENLGRVYAEEGAWRAVYERVAPGLAEYQRDAMAVYARERLAGPGAPREADGGSPGRGEART